jgi:hypothetical protein
MRTVMSSGDEIKVRVGADLKRSFQRACKSRDMSASQVIRMLMRTYIAECAEGKQPGLFEPRPSSSDIPNR